MATGPMLNAVAWQQHLAGALQVKKTARSRAVLQSALPPQTQARGGGQDA